LITDRDRLTRADAPAPGELRCEVLRAFALPERIEDQDHLALTGEPLGERLVGRSRLADVAVSARAHDRRHRARMTLRHVKIGRDQKPGRLSKITFSTLEVSRASTPVTRAWSDVFSGQGPNAS